MYQLNMEHNNMPSVVRNIYYRILLVPATQDPTTIVLFDITQTAVFQRQNTLTYQM